MSEETMDDDGRSLLVDVEELLGLETRQLDAELDEAERQRWVELSRSLLGVPVDVAERRRSLRIHVVRDAKVSGAEEDGEARVLSLGAGGLFVSTTAAPPVGEKMDVRVSLPMRHAEEISFRALVRWRTEGESTGDGPGRIGVGASFIRLGSRQRQAVIDLLKDRLYRDAYGALARYERIFEDLPDVVIRLDSDGRIVDANGRARTLLGRDGAPLRGVDVRDLVSSSSLALLTESLESSRSSGCTVQCELTFRGHEEGEPLTLDSILSPTRDADLGILLSGREVLDFDTVEEGDGP